MYYVINARISLSAKASYFNTAINMHVNKFLIQLCTYSYIYHMYIYTLVSLFFFFYIWRCTCIGIFNFLCI